MPGFAVHLIITNRRLCRRLQRAGNRHRHHLRLSQSPRQPSVHTQSSTTTTTIIEQ